MDPRTKERVERWESRPFSGEQDALATLADKTFSGAVTAAGVWVFMLNGRIVGVTDGSVENVLGASGTIYQAPADVLPLLSAMLEQGGAPRARYYTNDTSLTEVDRKLQQGSFTGYVELSEQVLSGDYYAVYYGGRRMSAAYIGNAERLLTGEEAFERADDEVGIYEVIDVDVSVTDVPGQDGTDDAAEQSPAGDRQSADRTTPDTDGRGHESGTESTGASDTGGAGSAVDGAANGRPTDGRSTVDATGSVDAAGSPADQPTNQPDTPDDQTSNAPTETEVAYTESDDTASGDASSTSPESSPPSTTPSDDQPGITTPNEVPESPSDGITTPTESTSADESASGSEATADASGTDHGTPADDAEEDEPDERFKEEERWRETRQIPSIDPDSTSETSAASGQSARSSTQSSQRASKSSKRPSPEDVASTEQALRSDMLEREDKVDHLTQRVTELEERRKQLVRERDKLVTENEELTALVSQLQERIEGLEQRIEQSQSEPAASTSTPPAQTTPSATDAAEITLSPTQALEQTNVFVRYASKSQPTLEAAHEGEGSRGDLDRNLQLERHTQFDAETAVVDEQPYESFVEESMQFQFVEWLVGTCLFEIRETGHAGNLADLYDVIPRIDRIELAATVSLEDDDTENVPDQVTFDVAAFDKRGTPLVVANCNDSRDPATQGMLEQLEADASSVCANYPELGAAVVVTSSFFDPGALELAEEVTTSGFLSRSSKVSYVNLSRKQGYHCCLVESRSGGFHLTVPEL